MFPCLFKKMFGFDCPGCGTQRSFLLLCHGKFTAAFHMFPAIYTLVLFGLVITLHFVDRTRNYHKLIIGLAIANAAITIISYIYKITNIN